MQYCRNILVYVQFALSESRVHFVCFILNDILKGKLSYDTDTDIIIIWCFFLMKSLLVKACQFIKNLFHLVHHLLNNLYTVTKSIGLKWQMTLGTYCRTSFDWPSDHNSDRLLQYSLNILFWYLTTFSLNPQWCNSLW